jgi:hypothetical protein
MIHNNFRTWSVVVILFGSCMSTVPLDAGNRPFNARLTLGLFLCGCGTTVMVGASRVDLKKLLTRVPNDELGLTTVNPDLGKFYAPRLRKLIVDNSRSLINYAGTCMILGGAYLVGDSLMENKKIK